MSKCFISYSRTDEVISSQLKERLEKYSHEVFLDTEIPPGEEWGKEIEMQIKSSDFFIVLLSKKSVKSEYVKKEVEIAYEASKKLRKRKKLTILPIRMDFVKRLSLQLGAFLDSFQHILWNTNDDFEVNAKKVLTAIEKRKPEPQKLKSSKEKHISNSKGDGHFKIPVSLETKLSALEHNKYKDEKGPVDLESPFYINRQTDDELIEQIKKSGTTVIVIGSIQMGKSSLLVREKTKSKELHQKICYIDFQSFDKSDFESFDKLFLQLARKICKELKMSINPDECWDKYGAKDNLIDFIKKILEEETESKLLILFDEVDRVFDCPFREDFFLTFRVWHNLRAFEEWKCFNRLNLVIATYIEPTIWLQDIFPPPINVAELIKMDDFNFEQVKELNEKYNKPLKTDIEILELMNLIGGQPFLVRKSFFEIEKNQYSIAQLKEIATTESGPFIEHLKIFDGFLKKKELKDSLNSILNREKCDNFEHFCLLKSVGLVTGETQRTAKMRYKIYSDYFKKHF